MSRYLRWLFLSLAVTTFAVPLVGCGGPEYAEEGEGKDMLEPGAMDAAAGGGNPEDMKP